MTFTSTDNSPPIFENGKLKPGIYKIQNLQTEGYVDIHEHLKEMWTETDRTYAYWIWKLLPVKVEGMITPSQSSSETLGSGPLPSYDEDVSGQSSTRTQYIELNTLEEFSFVLSASIVNVVVIHWLRCFRQILANTLDEINLSISASSR
ncbi:hypothetical protein BDM02DRAFT_3187328 [Thelephora ganbajun]|uniref:Uncharacterized protein n=1 Tax=Thelephora ganbajun TaxID=370292 RepID=A0ACB6ZF19_THEGA|nr:hypothetical protein BDM02DRAFT_3187328 [Thelephora ganbajun]